MFEIEIMCQCAYIIYIQGMQKSRKTNRQYQQLSRQIETLLRDFERNRQWADIGNWLSRLQPILSARHHSNLPQKITLAKRLAQCLNPTLPAGIHSNTLAVYNTIFTNFSCHSQLLALSAIGLFPFFEYSTSSLKIELIKIFESYYIKTPDCLQMIVSLMNALLTGLNENNEDLAKRIYGLCDKFAASYGRSWVDGAVWVNILKSPKVRIAGFKYLMKTFKDRDKIKKSENVEENKTSSKEISKQNEGKETEVTKSTAEKADNENGLAVSVHDSFMSENSIEENYEMLAELAKIKNLEDTDKLRFPHFSTLVVGALSQCLECPQSDTLVRRSALDLMIFYLRLDNTELISQKDAVHLVCIILQTVKLKEYSLTRRIYTYLFGQPNAEGVYSIDESTRKYELNLLKISLEKMLNESVEKSTKNPDGSLMTIIEILLNDHQKLREFVLPCLAFRLLTFLRISSLNDKRISQFYNNTILPCNQTFIRAIEAEILSHKVIESYETALETIASIDYFYTLRNSIEVSNKSEIPQEEIMNIIEWLLKYLVQTGCANEKVSIEVLELCGKFMRFHSGQQDQQLRYGIREQSIELLNQLISIRPSNAIYARLLNLHPSPSKQTLLPYMNEISLSIACITNLLSLDPAHLTPDQKYSIFASIFKLLNCHLWQDQAIEFIKLYKHKYPGEYTLLIDRVEPSEWLIYWRKMSGDVDGGVIRMLKNLDDDNHLNKQLSKKWVEGSKQICSRVVDPIYRLMREPSYIENIREIYKMIQRVFLIQKSEFITFFFLERDRYFLPLVDRIFECLHSQDEEIKAHSISMLMFIMERASNLEEKLAFISTTIDRSIFLLRKTLGGKGNYEREIEIVEYFISMVDLFGSFKGKEDKIETLKKLTEDSEIYETMALGMKETNVPYIRTLYIDFIQKSIQVFAEVTKDARFMSEIITCILEKLFIMLRENDVTMLEQIIKGKQLSQVSARRKKSEMTISIDPQDVSHTEFNVQAKYAQIIELWNSVKFLVNVSIKNAIGDLPIEKLLSLILQSFPFSEISFEQVKSPVMQNSYEQLQEEIRNMTGLKKEVLEIFDTLWENYEGKIINFLIEKGDPRVLIHGCVEPTAVVRAITKSLHCQKIAKYFKGSKFALPRGSVHYNTQILLIENHVNYFLYLYLLYCNLAVKNVKKANNFVESALNLIKSLKISCHVQTKLWILQLLYCLLERIPFRQLHQENPKLRIEMQQIVKQLLDDLIYVVAKSRSFTHRLEIKTGLFNIFGKEEEKESSLFDFVKVFPPTIYEMSQVYSESVKSKKIQHIVPVEDYIHHFLFSKWANLTEPTFVQYLSIATIKTYKKLYLPLLMNVYDQDIVKVASLTKDWLLVLFPLYENKAEDNQMYLETVAQFVHVLLTSNLRSEIIRNMRKNIMEIYMGNDFFKCTKNTLNNWKFIIDSCTENYDLLGELLSREGLFDGIFTRKAESKRLKIKNFERVCFLIYSGKIDKYENKLRIVLQSLNEVMKSQNPSPALLILILFCIRILLMRLSESALTRMFKSFWPSLITLLIQIYSKQSFSTCTNLLLAGLKVIELVHALQLEDFNIHRWIFIFDYFGIRIDSPSESEALSATKKFLTPFNFRPMLTKVLPQNPLKCTFVPEQWPDQSAEPCKRKLIVKQASIESDQQLRNHTLILMQYMMDINQKRVTVVREQIEDLIQADFISMDDYIFLVQ